MEIHRPVGRNAVTVRGLDRVYVRAEEQKLPSGFFLPTADLTANLVRVIAMTGVFHAVGRNDEQRFMRHILRTGIPMHNADMVHGVAQRIEQRGAAAGDIVALAQRLDLCDRDAVVQHGRLLVEQHGGDIDLAGERALLRNHSVEPADGVRFQPRHGAAAIDDPDHFQ